MSTPQAGKFIPPPKNLSISRHGTFLSSHGTYPGEMRERIGLALIRSLDDEKLTTEEIDIIKKIQSELTPGNLSRTIQMEDKKHHTVISNQEIEWLHHHRENDWTKYLIYRYQFKVYPGQRKLKAFPLHLLIEPTSICNLRCIMCYQIDKTFTTKDFMGNISWDLFTSLVDQAKQHECQAITLAARGEPTLHPKIGEMLKYLADSKIMDLKINTNATKLTEKICHYILSADINEVVFSVDAGTKETYENIRVNGKFNQVVKNIEQFHNIREKSYKNSHTVTRISGIKVSEAQDENQMNDFWKQRVDQVAIKRATPRWDSYNNDLVEIDKPCNLLWERLYVWYNGITNPCDFDYKSQLSPGNANETKITDIWLGEKFQKLREAHLEKRRSKHTPCDRCPLH